MQPEGPARFQISAPERLLGWVRFTQPSRMIVRHLSRRPGRTLLSITGIAMATAGAAAHDDDDIAMSPTSG